MQASNATTVARPLLGARVQQVLLDYLALTKPRVQSLLLLTTISTMYVAGDPSLGLVALTCLGGSLSAGGAVFGIFAGLYYWFPKMSGRMMSESLGKVSFWTMFVGFNTTFLVQHSAGLSGMPRRIYDYDESLGVGTYNLISTIGAFIFALGILVTIINVVRSLRTGPIAGPDPWKGNTLEWFIPSPPPVNNFDTIPRVRSVEPMKDIRRQVERQTRPAETVPAGASGGDTAAG